ncbi:hypothetical protein Tco_0771178 [Tanacetum coccineum]|uniref:Transmembrane protein n=1 Tax=Tanacetum coccineum TaxID=301880 RepID=A0ABQ4ZHU6_9ASTR
MTNRGTVVLSDPVHANTSLFSRRTSANNCLQLVVKVVPIVTYWSGCSWLMVNASFAFSQPHVFSSDIGSEVGPIPELLFVLRITCSLILAFALHADATVPPSMILVPFLGVFILVEPLYWFPLLRLLVFLRVSDVPEDSRENRSDNPLASDPAEASLSEKEKGLFFAFVGLVRLAPQGFLFLRPLSSLLEIPPPLAASKPCLLILGRLGCRVPRMAPNVEVNLRGLLELDKSDLSVNKD